MINLKRKRINLKRKTYYKGKCYWKCYIGSDCNLRAPYLLLAILRAQKLLKSLTMILKEERKKKIEIFFGLIPETPCIYTQVSIKYINF